MNETRNFIEEINQNELMRKKHKKVCTTLNYIEHSFILSSVVIGYVSVFNFSSLFGILIDITNS